MNCSPPGPGSLSISKKVTGGPSGYVGPFDIQYTCTNGGPSGTAGVTAGVPFVIPNIPNGGNAITAAINRAAVVVGADFHFGHRRGGNVALLEKMGADLGFEVIGLGLVAPESDPAHEPFTAAMIGVVLAITCMMCKKEA